MSDRAVIIASSTLVLVVAMICATAVFMPHPATDVSHLRCTQQTLAGNNDVYFACTVTDIHP